jgi:DNA-binding response OmpR family regulator
LTSGGSQGKLGGVRKRVLVVDDDAAILESIEMVLEETYEVRLARDGQEALDLLEREPFDAIILDLMMPVLDGAGMMQRMRERGLRVPVLIASAGTDLKRRALELGATDWMAKPFRVELLEEKLLSVLHAGASAPGP